MIRPVERRDLDRVLDLFDALNAQGTASDPRYRVRPDARERQRLTILDLWFGAFHPFPPCLVLELEDEVVGLISGRPGLEHPILELQPTAKIETIWVDAAHRRQGWALKLVAAYCEAAARGGCPWVEVGTLAKDARAVGFWRAAGFDDLRLTLGADTTTRTSH